MKLSDYFENDMVSCDGEFAALGYIDSNVPGTLVYCDTVYYLKKATANPNITCVITTPDLAEEIEKIPGIVSSLEPRTTFYRLHNTIVTRQTPRALSKYGMGESCQIHPSAVISDKANIGNRVTIAENVTIKDEVDIGDDCFIDANAVIGAEGLLYYMENGMIIAIRHAGGVKIGERVTILSGAVIVKSVHGHMLTTIGDRSIIGVSTNIGHEAMVGNDCVISSNCVVARRAILEEGVKIGPSVTIREHVRVRRHAHIRLGSTVIEDVNEGQSISGDFAVDHMVNLKSHHRKKRNIK